MQRKSYVPGFTLIELIAVIAIIGILATFAAVSISGSVKRARDALRQQDLNNVKDALELYNTDEGQYPNAGSDQSIPAELKDKGYIRTIPVDSRGLAYKYYVGNQNQDYVLLTELEYKRAKRTAPTDSEGRLVDCDDAADYNLKGNGVLTGGSLKACFRLTND